jgi:hypothetical protein
MPTKVIHRSTKARRPFCLLRAAGFIFDEGIILDKK